MMHPFFKKIVRVFLHAIAILFLTILTQIGGVLYMICLFVLRKRSFSKWFFKPLIFLLVYFSVTLGVIPFIAPLFGRERIVNTAHLIPHNYFYLLANRNYVKPALNKALHDISREFGNKNPEIKIAYLDANFPFIDGFPLLPHLSHKDGKKVDITLLYDDEEGILSNEKKSFSGYGVYEEPIGNEYDQPLVCKKEGYWQYDFTKYTPIVSYNKEYTFSVKGNKELAKLIVANKQVGKVFVEPHLKTRMGITNSKFRFHGCGAVRHDDHFHIQLK